DKRSRRLLAQYFQIALSVTYEVRLLGRISVKQDACIGLAPDEFRDRLRMLLEPRMKLFDCPRITRRLVPICIDKIEIERHRDDDRAKTRPDLPRELREETRNPVPTDERDYRNRRRDGDTISRITRRTQHSIRAKYGVKQEYKKKARCDRSQFPSFE